MDTQHMCRTCVYTAWVCRESVCTYTVCVCLCCQGSVLLGELTQAKIWGPFLRTLGLLVTSVLGRKGGGCGCWDFLQSKRGSL